MKITTTLTYKLAALLPAVALTGALFTGTGCDQSADPNLNESVIGPDATGVGALPADDFDTGVLPENAAEGVNDSVGNSADNMRTSGDDMMNNASGMKDDVAAKAGELEDKAGDMSAAAVDKAKGMIEEVKAMIADKDFSAASDMVTKMEAMPVYNQLPVVIKDQVTKLKDTISAGEGMSSTGMDK